MKSIFVLFFTMALFLNPMLAFAVGESTNNASAAHGCHEWAALMEKDRAIAAEQHSSNVKEAPNGSKQILISEGAR